MASKIQFELVFGQPLKDGKKEVKCSSDHGIPQNRRHPLMSDYAIIVAHIGNRHIGLCALCAQDMLISLQGKLNVYNNMFQEYKG